MCTRKAVLGVLAVLTLGTALPAQSAELTLRFSHFWPAGSRQNTEIFEAWAKAVEEDSNGRIKIQMFPSQTLTKADQSYQATAQGITDISATAQGYTAGRFPLSQLVELPPFGETAEQGSCVLQKLYDDGAIADEYKDNHVVFLFTHGPGYLHTVQKPVRQPAELGGLRIRRPTAVVADMLKNQGANPVGMPAPEVYQSLQRGVLDGLTMPWEGMHVFRLTELTTQHLEVPMYRLEFVVSMNRRVYDGLPADLKKVIDDNSGLAWSRKAGQVFDQIDKTGRQAAVDAGKHTIIEPTKEPDMAQAWHSVIDSMITNYVAEVEAKGLPAQQVYDKAVSLVADCR